MSDAPHDLASNQTIIAAIVAGVGTIIVGLLSYFGGRGSVQAQLQNQLNLSFQSFTDQLQEERRHDREEIGGCKRRCLALEGEVRGLQQHITSLENLLRDQGLTIPERPRIEVVMILDSSVHHQEHAA